MDRVCHMISWPGPPAAKLISQFLQFSVLVKSPPKLDHDSVFIPDVTVNVQHKQHLQCWFQDTSQ